MTRALPIASKIAVLIVFTAACAVPVEDSVPFGAELDEAAAAHGVPRELLVAIATVESGFVMHGAQAADGVDALRDFADVGALAPLVTALDPAAFDDSGEGQSSHHPRCYGLMGLCAGTTLEQAAGLLGVDAGELRSDPLVHVHGVAALLAKYKKDAEKGGWEEAVRRFGARGSPIAAEIFLREVARHAPLVLTNIPGVQELRPDSSLARWVGSPNYRAANRTRGQVDRIVIHTIQGSYSGGISWMQNPRAQVSAHYAVRSRDGEISQMVEEHDIAWHVSCWNGRSIGIEHEGFAQDPGAWYTDAMYRSSARLVREVANRWGIPLDRDHILGHADVSRLSGCNDHWDPGPGWDWNKFMSYVREGTGGGTTPPTTPTPQPQPTTGKVRGAIYDVAHPMSDSNNRLSGALVTLSNGAHTTTGSTGMYVFDVAPGDYTVTVSKAGWSTERAARHVSANADSWASIALRVVAPPAGQGKLVGVIYDAARGSSARIGGATVQLSTGARVTADSAGYFEFSVPVGTYTATASKAGWNGGSQTRAVTANQSIWGSIGLRQ